MINEEIYTCIFGGGAVRGIAYVGAVKALQEMKINCNTYVGSSVGAVIASLLALNLSSNEIGQLLVNVNFELFRDIHLDFNKNVALSKGDIFTQWIRDIIEKNFYGSSYQKRKNKPVRFCDIEKNLVILTTDLTTYTCYEFSKKETPNFEIAEAIRISCSMPGLITPTKIDNKILVDGDLLKSVPLWKLSKNLKLFDNKILEFRLEGETNNNGNAFDFVNSVYSCMTSASTDYIISLYNDMDDFDYIKLNTGDVLIVNFNISSEERNKLISLGYEQTITYLTQTMPKKKKNLIEKYNIISKYLVKIYDSVRINNINKSKTLLGELYLELIDLKPAISTKVFEDLQKLKIEILNTSLTHNWIGKQVIKDKKTLIDQISALISSINDRTKKLQHSIQKNELLVPIHF